MVCGKLAAAWHTCVGQDRKVALCVVRVVAIVGGILRNVCFGMPPIVGLSFGICRFAHNHMADRFALACRFP